MGQIRNSHPHRLSSKRTTTREQLLAQREAAHQIADAQQRALALRRIRSRLESLKLRSLVGE